MGRTVGDVGTRVGWKVGALLGDSVGTNVGDDVGAVHAGVVPKSLCATLDKHGARHSNRLFPTYNFCKGIWHSGWCRTPVNKLFSRFKEVSRVNEPMSEGTLPPNEFELISRS